MKLLIITMFSKVSKSSKFLTVPIQSGKQGKIPKMQHRFVKIGCMQILHLQCLAFLKLWQAARDKILQCFTCSGFSLDCNYGEKNSCHTLIIVKKVSTEFLKYISMEKSKISRHCYNSACS